MTPVDVSTLSGLLVGYGSIGRRHLRNLHDLGVHDWAVVHTGAGTLPFEPPCPVRTYRDLDAALLAERPHFAVIANPTALHLPSAIACTRRGCDLLLEKPVSHALDGIEDLTDEVARQAARVLVGYQFRFDPGLHRVGALLHRGSLGRPLEAQVTWSEHLPDWHPWEDWRAGYAARRELGGGVHHTLSHPFDYLRMLLGDVRELTSTLVEHGPLELDVAEAVDATLRFDSGASASVHLDYWGHPDTHRAEFVCTNGAVRWDALRGELRVRDTPDAAWRCEPVPGLDARDALFVAEARHFIDVVTRRSEPVCTLDDGIQATRICAAIEGGSAG
jgi:predicted dehydrogenase